MGIRIPRENHLGPEGDPAAMHAMLYFTAKDEDDAARIARHLLDRRLIACANVFPVRSIYRWEGAVEDVREAAAVCKTRKSLVARAIREAKAVHAYEVPCIVSYAMGPALAAYGAWIDAETRRSKRRRSEGEAKQVRKRSEAGLTRRRGRRTRRRGPGPS
jgi:periplasmic divalent cation tolerance protein